MTRLAGWIANYDSPSSIGSRLRRARVGPLLSMIDHVYETRGLVRILDVGGTRNYWSICTPGYLKSRDVRITLVNVRGGSRTHGAFSDVVGDGCALPYEDNSFDIAHSNSVIEHVGDWGRMTAFAGEIRRLAPNYFVQTPYFWFPLDPHSMTLFFHWLPRPVQVGMLRRFALGQYAKRERLADAVRTVETAQLLDRSMFKQLFPDALLQTEWLGPFPKSLIAIRDERGADTTSSRRQPTARSAT